MGLNKLLVGTAIAALALTASAANAGTVSTIWGNSATNGAPLLQQWDLSGNLLRTINAPNGFNGRGIVQVGDVVYYTSASTNGVYAYNFMTNTDLGTVFTVAGASGLATMAYDGSHFFIGDYSGTQNAYEYSLTGTLVKTIALKNCSGFCDGLEFANGHLVSNEYDGGFGGSNTYDVYDLNGNVTTAGLIHGQDSSGNTGIAFDGTDYYVSNIFVNTIGVYDGSGNFLHNIVLQTGGNPTLVEDLSVNYTQVLSVPEPATWGMMIAGLGLAGAALRRRRTSFAAI